MTRPEKLEELYQAALTLSHTFLEHVNYAKSALNSEDIAALNEFHMALNKLKKEA
ncbi:hypothetical protein [Exercitatus varius]|uniref:hypothetical protein n=1 Tax=Exercitatus varius TaxID=67857 RepID=UPI00294AA1AD|nr:hypothetical protein [Exercitatus varius]MDG2961730.1 hypothetical protein [Exercitatus varius]